MENCIVSKLIGEVNNDNLSIFGKAKILVGNGNPSVQFNKITDVQVLGGSIDGQTSIHVLDNIALIIDSSTIVSDGTYGENTVALLVDKYNITSIERFTKIDAEDFLFAPLTKIQTYYSETIVENPEYLIPHFSKDEFLTYDSRSTSLPIDISELGSNGNMVSIRLLGAGGYYGNLDKAGMSPLSSNFTTPNTKNVSLNIENFVGYHRAAGRTTGSMSIEWLGACNCTFNGAAVENQQNNSLSWTATTITLNGTTIDA